MTKQRGEMLAIDKFTLKNATLENPS